jgi:hypothetical protein
VTVSSAVLGPASSNVEDPDKEPLLPYLMVPGNLRKGFSCKGYYPYSALVDLSTAYNFISQAIEDCPGLKAVMKLKLPPIATVNGKLLYATTIVRAIVRMWEIARMKWSHTINFVMATIAHYNMILAMIWLQTQNPDFQ